MTEDDTFIKLAKPTFVELLVILDKEPVPLRPILDILILHHWSSEEFSKEYARRRFT